MGLNLILEWWCDLKSLQNTLSLSCYRSSLATRTHSCSSFLDCMICVEGSLFVSWGREIRLSIWILVGDFQSRILLVGVWSSYGVLLDGNYVWSAFLDFFSSWIPTIFPWNRLFTYLSIILIIFLCWYFCYLSDFKIDCM